jgi:hypothetical protein
MGESEAVHENMLTKHGDALLAGSSVGAAGKLTIRCTGAPRAPALAFSEAPRYFVAQTWAISNPYLYPVGHPILFCFV